MKGSFPVRGKPLRWSDLGGNSRRAPQIPIDYRYNDKQNRAKAQLAALGITDGKLVATILNSHLEEFYKWNHGYQTGKFKVKTSPSGHLLRSLGMA